MFTQRATKGSSHMKSLFWTAVFASAIVMPYLLLRKKEEEQQTPVVCDDSFGYGMNDYLDDSDF